MYLCCIKDHPISLRRYIRFQFRYMWLSLRIDRSTDRSPAYVPVPLQVSVVFVCLRLAIKATLILVIDILHSQPTFVPLRITCHIVAPPKSQ